MLEFILCDDVEKHNSYLKKAIDKVLENKQLNGVISYVSQEPKDVLNYSKRNRCKSMLYIRYRFSWRNELSACRKIRE